MFRLEIDELDNPADDPGYVALSQMIKNVAEVIYGGATSGTIHDSEGNPVGRFSVGSSDE